MVRMIILVWMDRHEGIYGLEGIVRIVRMIILVSLDRY